MFYYTVFRLKCRYYVYFFTLNFTSFFLLFRMLVHIWYEASPPQDSKNPLRMPAHYRFTEGISLAYFSALQGLLSR